MAILWHLRSLLSNSAMFYLFKRNTIILGTGSSTECFFDVIHDLKRSIFTGKIHATTQI